MRIHLFILAYALLVQARPKTRTLSAADVAIQKRQVNTVQLRRRLALGKVKRGDVGCAANPAPTTASCSVLGGPTCTNCQSNCVNLQSNNANCGSCGNVCHDMETCSNAICKPQCSLLGLQLDTTTNLCICAGLSVVRVGTNSCLCNASAGLILAASTTACVCANAAYIFVGSSCVPKTICPANASLNLSTNVCFCNNPTQVILNNKCQCPPGSILNVLNVCVKL